MVRGQQGLNCLSHEEKKTSRSVGREAGEQSRDRHLGTDTKATRELEPELKLEPN